MADTSSPKQQNTDVTDTADAGSEFPQKLRVHALARMLGLTSKVALEHLNELGFVARSAHSSIDRSAAERVRDRVGAASSDDTDNTAAPAATSDDSSVESPSLFSAAPAVEASPVVDDTPAPPVADAGVPLFLQPEAAQARTAAPERTDTPPARADDSVDAPTEPQESNPAPSTDSDDESGAGARRRRRGRRGRGRGRGDNADESDTNTGSGAGSEPDDAAARPAADAAPASIDANEAAPAQDDAPAETDSQDDAQDDSQGDDPDDVTDSGARRRRRRRRKRSGGADDEPTSSDDPPNTVVHEREPRQKTRRDEVRGISGSTRLEAKRQRRRDGRDTVRRRPPILTESEFLARRESVDRVMVVRERTGVQSSAGQDGHSVAHPADYTQVAVLEDGVLVEHFVTSSSSASMAGNIYLGRVQNVLPSMEAAFVDIGRGRNGVLYAGEVNWDAAGLDGNARKIEQALKPGDQVLVQVSKDPVGHKGARLTTQISLAGRFLVYVPGGGSAGISRKLPDTERKRLKEILKDIVPTEAGVIIRTASEGVSAEELAGDVTRLQEQWATIEKESSTKGVRPLYEEPDLLVKVVRDLFNEDFSKLVIEGEKEFRTVEKYVEDVAPELLPRVERFDKPHADAPDVFAAYRIDEQLAKALDRKVWLPSGGTLVIDRTEAMTVVDVNTGKFTGSGGNLEETVTRNNLEAAEEIVRQMRLRDIGGMIVVDFIDMVLESNRDLVLRRLTEALGRDRTRHQVSEVTSLGLVQMTRKRIGTGLVEAFSTSCQACAGRGIIIHADPVETPGNGDEPSRPNDKADGSSGRKKRKRSRPDAGPSSASAPVAGKDEKTTPKGDHPMFKAMASHSDADDGVDTAPPSPEVTTESASATPDRAVTAPEPTPEPTPESTPEPAPEPTPERAAPQRRRRVARKATTTTAAEPQTIVVDLAQDAPVAASAPAAPVTVPAGSAGETSAAPARTRARRRAAARPAGPATASEVDAPAPADERRADQPV